MRISDWSSDVCSSDLKGYNVSIQKALIASIAVLSLAACAKVGDIDVTGCIIAKRSACPSVAIPDYTGDIILFNPPQSRQASAIDVLANITNLRSDEQSSALQSLMRISYAVSRLKKK